MPLNKIRATVDAGVAVAPVVAASAASVAAVEPKKRLLKAKAAPAAVGAAVEETAKAAATVGLQPTNMDSKEKRIQRSGIWQAVVQSNALVQYAPTLDAWLELVDKAADRGLQYVNRP